MASILSRPQCVKHQTSSHLNKWTFVTFYFHNLFCFYKVRSVPLLVQTSHIVPGTRPETRPTWDENVGEIVWIHTALTHLNNCTGVKVLITKFHDNSVQSKLFRTQWFLEEEKPPLSQVMAWCHYLNQCWLVISKVQWQSQEGYFTQLSITKTAWKLLI